MNRDEFERRLEHTKSQGGETHKNPVADVLTQKLLQELGQLSEQVKSSEARATNLEKAFQEQGEVLKGIAAAQRNTGARIHQVAETQKVQAVGLSETDTISLVSDKMFAFKVQLVCLIGAIAMAVAGYLMWQDIKGNTTLEPQKGSIFSDG